MVHLSQAVGIMLVFVAVQSYAAPVDTSQYAIIDSYQFERGDSHDYKFGFKTSDGTTREEIGENDQSNSLAVNGNVSWIAQDGSVYEMYFKADKKGFRPIIKRISGP